MQLPTTDPDPTPNDATETASAVSSEAVSAASSEAVSAASSEAVSAASSEAVSAASSEAVSAASSEAASAASSVSVRAGLVRLAEIAVAAHGCELVDIEWRRESNGWVARVFIERLGHDPRLAVGGVSLEACSGVSRDLGTAIEVEELIAHAFNLEVSSPGLERALTKASDFRRFAGLRAKVTLRQPLDAHPNRRVLHGTGVAHDRPGVIVFDDESIGRVEFPESAMARGHLIYVPPKHDKPGKAPKAGKNARKNIPAARTRDAESTRPGDEADAAATVRRA